MCVCVCLREREASSFRGTLVACLCSMSLVPDHRIKKCASKTNETLQCSSNLNSTVSQFRQKWRGRFLEGTKPVTRGAPIWQPKEQRRRTFDGAQMSSNALPSSSASCSSFADVLPLLRANYTIIIARSAKVTLL